MGENDEKGVSISSPDSSKKIFGLILIIAVLLAVLGTWSMLNYTALKKAVESGAAEKTFQSTSSASIQLAVIKPTAEQNQNSGAVGG